MNTEQFIDLSNKTHNNRYSYEHSVFVNWRSKIVVTCAEHGPFETQAFTHAKQATGCKKCGLRKIGDLSRKTTEQFIKEAIAKHGDRYDYSKVQYVRAHGKVIIICKIHGEFSQKARQHLSGYNCPFCALRKFEDKLQHFLTKAKIRHGDEYNYDKVCFIDSKTPIEIECKKHGVFCQRPYLHYAGHGCPRCPSFTSAPQQEIIDFVSCFASDITTNDRTIIAPYELDIIINNKLAIEFNGNYYHSYNYLESTEQRRYHQNKFKRCLDNGLRLIQIAEYEWIFKKEIVKSILTNALCGSASIYARNCDIIEINNNQHREFMDSNHIYGGKDISVCYGLRADNMIIQMMSFTRLDKNSKWEIARLASCRNMTVVGGASKLYKHFLRQYKPSVVVTYADCRFSVGKVYEYLGFKSCGITSPNYVYIKNKQWWRRQSFQKHKLPKILSIFDPLLTEAENMFINGYRRMWDAGHHKFIAEY